MAPSRPFCHEAFRPIGRGYLFRVGRLRPRVGRNLVGAVRALLYRVAPSDEVVGCVDEAEMGERLRKVADETLADRIVLLRQQTETVSER